MKTNTLNTPLQRFLRDFDELFSDYGRGIPEAQNKKDVEVELPFAGLGKEDISIHAEGNQVTLSVTTKNLTGYRKSYEGFKKTYLVDPDYDLAKITATMQNGLLTLRVPLKEQAKQTQFQIAVN